MDSPIQFPDPQDEMRRRCKEFQRLSSSDKWNEIIAIMASGWKMIKSSPNREAIEKRMDEQEQEWQRIQQEIFVKYGR